MSEEQALLEYGAGSQLRHPRQFLRATRRNFVASWHVAPRLTMRGLRSQYRNSFLGYFWIVGPSLAVTAVWLYLNHTKVVNGGPTRIPYGVFVLVGTLLWNAFTEALNAPITQLTSASQLLSKVNFPPESLLLTGLATVLINAVVRMVLVIPVFAFSGVRPGWGLVLFPVGMVALILLGFAFGLLLAPIGALYRDVGQTLVIVTSFLFLVTPVAYADHGVGSRHGTIITYNPIRPVLDASREWLTGGALSPGRAWYGVMAMVLAVLAFGWALFRLSIPHLVDRISP